MRRIACLLLLGLSAFTTLGQTNSGVQTIGEVSFAVPEGWTYMPARDGGAMVLKQGSNYWIMAVYSTMPSSGDATQDLKAAWTRIVLAGPDYRGLPALPYYDINHTVGYPGKRADDSSVNRATYTRMYILETGKSFVPVVCVSNDGTVLNSQEHMANALIGSVRLAPMKAEPIKTNLNLPDMVGHWKSGAGSSYNFYNQFSGRYEGNVSSFYGAGYTINADGSFKYQMSGMVNGRVARDDDTGVVQFEKEFVVFKGHNHVVRYRFLNIQRAIDGSTVMTFLPAAADPSTLSIIRDSEPWIREPKK